MPGDEEVERGSRRQDRQDKQKQPDYQMTRRQRQRPGLSQPGVEHYYLHRNPSFPYRRECGADEM
jgi:hypothetical protein